MSDSHGLPPDEAAPIVEWLSALGKAISVFDSKLDDIETAANEIYNEYDAMENGGIIGKAKLALKKDGLVARRKELTERLHGLRQEMLGVYNQNSQAVDAAMDLLLEYDLDGDRPGTFYLERRPDINVHADNWEWRNEELDREITRTRELDKDLLHLIMQIMSHVLKEEE